MAYKWHLMYNMELNNEFSLIYLFIFQNAPEDYVTLIMKFSISEINGGCSFPQK